jgi:site-specific recombinase XerD
VRVAKPGEQTMRTTKKKEPVTLRQKALANGNISLYLDIYQNGRRAYEFLKLYLVKPTSAADRELNKQTLATAQAIRAKRQIDLQNGAYGFNSTFKGRVLLLDYYRHCVDASKKPGTNGTHVTWQASMKILEAYCKPNTELRALTREWVQGYKDYIDAQPIRQNSKLLYFSKFKACINKAIREGLIVENPCAAVPNFTKAETERAYLTQDELQALAHTYTQHTELRRAFLFSCLTGLRASDVEALTWGQVQEADGRTRIVFSQKKTGGIMYLDIAAQAVGYMGERGEAGARVFAGFHNYRRDGVHLLDWCRAAGIDKHITFHSARHTFATLELTLGADLYTVSKLLGHSKISTTEIYAKIVDAKRRDAVDLIPDITK